MKLIFKGSFRFPTEYILRRCGYGKQLNRTGEVSYARVMGISGYPRFHAYVEEHADGFQVNLHLDQKKPSYGGHTAHSGEYEGTVVEAEGARLQRAIRSMVDPLIHRQPE